LQGAEWQGRLRGHCRIGRPAVVRVQQKWPGGNPARPRRGRPSKSALAHLMKKPRRGRCRLIFTWNCGIITPIGGSSNAWFRSKPPSPSAI